MHWALEGKFNDGHRPSREFQLTFYFCSKDVYLEFPVTVVNPAALPELLYEPYPPDCYDVGDNLPPLPFHSAASSPSPRHNMSPPLYDHSLPSISPPAVLPFVGQGRVWLPPMSPSLQVGYNPHTAPLPCPGYPIDHPSHNIPLYRPSSAEPSPSDPFYPPPPGPPTSVVQPLFSAVIESSSTAERVEGKGERASRISHHLRMSSRTRSVSPLSHRYATPATRDECGSFNQGHLSLVNQLASPQAESAGVPSPIPQGSPNSDVASPRPMPSPKQTFSVDPITHLSFSKSERVEALERIAKETDDANRDMSSSVPDLTLDKNKTLPAPPVPSQKPPRSSEPPVPLPNLFSSSQDPDPDMTPPTPTLAAFTSKKASRAALGQLGGLDALEARLLSEVGTRKVEQDFTRPDVRAVMPIAIPKPDVVEPAIDSAISSLSLQGLGADEGTLRNGPDDQSGQSSERGRPRTRDAGMEEAEEASLRPSKESEGKRVKKKKSGQKAHGEFEKEKELHRLRKAAQGRITAWLGGIDPEAPPQPPPTPPCQESPRAPVKEIADDEPRYGVQPEPISHTTTSPAPCDKVQEAEPNPRSSGFMPIRLDNNPAARSDKAPWDKGAFPVWPKPKLAADPEVRYDVRSARGGRGGQVTAVAAIWAAQATGKQPAAVKATSPPPKRLTQWGKTPSTPSPLSQSSAKPQRPNPVPPSPGTHGGDLGAKRAKLAKSSSVPAVVSSSLATPMLSSTASLAKPSPVAKPRTFQLPTTILENDTRNSKAADTKPPPPPKELVFGQARLRELIKKYQG